MKELFLFVRPPRPLWPMSGPNTAFWPPLAFASLAAMLREQVPDLRVAILDAPIVRMGWRSLGEELRRLRPGYVGIGEEAVSCVEGLRLARLAKALGARVIAGGCFFGQVAEQVLRTGLVDVVVHGEGELTLVDVVQAWRDRSKPEFGRVSGISFRADADITHTGPRPLIADLDSLPFPAYDLLPVECYGRGSRNHPRLACLELGRGCVDSCHFCVLWRQMGHFRGNEVRPHLRVKSPERLLEEVRLVVRKHARNYIGWVDPCFNAHPAVPGRLAELLLREDLCVGQSAWMRADGIVRDEASGQLGRCVEAGLNEVYIGVERAESEELEALGKHERLEQARQAFDILHRNHPVVYTVGSFIYGLPADTPATVRKMHRMALDLGMDKAFFIPFTPLPGTPFWRSEFWDPSGEKFRGFSFLPNPVLANGRAPLDRALIRSLLLDWRPLRTLDFLLGWSSRDARRRRIRRRMCLRATSYSVKLAVQSLLGRRPTGGLVFPKWYES